jgi:chemotaxis protein MotB
MKNLFSTLPFFIVLLLISACVPAKKYKDLLEREKVCSEELSKFKKSSGEYEALSKDLQIKFANASRDLSKLIQDTTALGSKYRLLLRDYGIIAASINHCKNHLIN